LERILLEPPESAARPAALPSRLRRRPRAVRPLALGLAVALAALAVASAPFLRSAPDVVARAAAALNDPSTILHLMSVDAGGNTTEVWTADGGRKQRFLYRGGTDRAVESALDWDANTEESWAAERNEIVVASDPGFDTAKVEPQGLGSDRPSSDVLDDLAAVLDRARHGDGNAHLVGETTVRGIAVYQLRVDYTTQVLEEPIPKGFTGDPWTLPSRTISLSRDVYVDRDTFLPVRVADHFGPGLDSTVDYTLAERLPRTPDNERLLQLSPHPGAKQVVEATP
jgi:hypothetical protein